jgi:catechol 2,3-dioxygenase-like lactoylglutathione lyase family enzyme
MSTQEDRKQKLAGERGRIVPRKLAHVVRRTPRFEEMVRWYCTVLGAEVVHSNGMLAFLTYDDEHHRLAIAGIPGLPDQPGMTAGTDHIAFTFADLGDLLYTFRRLKAEGIEPYWCVNHGPTISMYYHDPDGNSVELQVDRYRTKEECSAYFTTDAFRRNPIGVNFDPAELAARYEAGVPEDELMSIPDGPPAPLGSATR